MSMVEARNRRDGTHAALSQLIIAVRWYRSFTKPLLLPLLLLCISLPWLHRLLQLRMLLLLFMFKYPGACFSICIPKCKKVYADA